MNDVSDAVCSISGSKELSRSLLTASVFKNSRVNDSKCETRNNDNKENDVSFSVVQNTSI
jgi:hypothetical protein